MLCPIQPRQAHPDKALAARLHAARPSEYRDANHKPEMAISLTDFEAMCGFRPLPDVVAHMKAYPELRALVSDQGACWLGCVVDERGKGRDGAGRKEGRRVR